MDIKEKESEFLRVYGELGSGTTGRYEMIRAIIMSLILLVFSLFFPLLLYPGITYLKAEQYFLHKEYNKAAEEYLKIPDFKDSDKLLSQCRYNNALLLFKEGRFDEARKIFSFLAKDNFANSLNWLKETDYKIALKSLNDGDYRRASGVFNALFEFRDSKLRYYESVFYLILDEYGKGNREGALRLLHILTDAGYFSLKPLKEPERVHSEQSVRPSCINLYADLSGSSGNYEDYTGGGCIYKITEDHIYFLTASHVLEEMGKAEIEITFFDGSGITVSPQTLLSEDGSDLAMFCIDTALIPPETLLTLKEIYFSPEIYDLLKENDPAFIYSSHFFKKDDLITDTEFISFESTAFTEGYYNREDYLVFKRSSEKGQSGSPVFDLYGRCIALVSGYYYTTLEEETIYEVDCYSRLDKAPLLYEELNSIGK